MNKRIASFPAIFHWVSGQQEILKVKSPIRRKNPKVFHAAASGGLVLKHQRMKTFPLFCGSGVHQAYQNSRGLKDKSKQKQEIYIYNCLYIYICTCIFIENGGNPQRETPNPYVGILRLVTVRIAKQDIRLFKSPSIRGTGGVWTQGHLQYIRVLFWMSWPLIGSMARNMGSFTHVSHRVYESYPPWS